MPARRFLFASILLGILCLSSACGQATPAQTETQTVQMHAPPTAMPALQPPAPTVASTPATPPGNPIHITIPAIQVDADIEPVGLLDNNNLDTPQTNPWDSTGWYDQGPLPGALGSAVIDGHVDRPDGGPAIFWYLHNLKPGDAVLITTDTGKHLTFHVKYVTQYAPQEAPLQSIFGDMSGNYLNLITCAGDWIPQLNETSLRTVVYTTLG